MLKRRAVLSAVLDTGAGVAGLALDGLRRAASCRVEFEVTLNPRAALLSLLWAREWTTIEADDYNLDARKEIRLASDRLIAYVSPARGGHLYELDIRGTKVNLLATLNRRPEPYHRKILAGAKQSEFGESVALHEQIKFKQPDLDKKLDYDLWPRKSLVDHFLRPGTDLDEFLQGGGGISDFVQGVYDAKMRRTDRRVEVTLSREGSVPSNGGTDHWVRLTKTVVLNADVGGLLDITYQLDNLTPGAPFHFAVEFNFAAMAAGADDRYYYDSQGRQLGQLQTIHNLDPVERIGADTLLIQKPFMAEELLHKLRQAFAVSPAEPVPAKA